MTTLAQEAAKLVDALPADKAQALIEYARYLAEKADEEAWDNKFGDAKYAPKLKTLMSDVEAEIAAEKDSALEFKPS
jgi:hypothetical protein